MGTTTSASPTTSDGRSGPVATHIGGLDGLRGLAVAAVVAYHLDLLSGGFLGVDVFFVLSGFLITSLLLGELGGTGTVSLRRFWGRRIRRLVPAVAVVVPVTLVAAVLLDWPRTRLGAAAIDGFATLTWWANWRQAEGTSYWAADSPNLFRHAWSLAIEEQFYVVWPLAVVLAAALAHRWGRSVAGAVGATAFVAFAASSAWLVVLSRRLGDDELSRAYVGTDTRVLAPLAGCVLACWLARRSRGGQRDRTALSPAAGWTLRLVGFGGLGALAWAMVAADVASPALYRSGGFVAVALAATAVVAMIVLGSPGGTAGPTERWASIGVLRYLGLRSYGIYLWSWPLQVLVVAVVAASLVIAELSYRLVEDPIRRRRSWVGRPLLRRPTVRVPALATALVLPFAVVVAVDVVAEDPPVHEVVDTAETITAGTAPPPTRVPQTTAPEEEAPADGGPDEEAPTVEVDDEPLYVMVIGDSIAFTAVFHLGGPPEGVASVDGRAVIGCGVLAADLYEYRSALDTWALPASGACVDQHDVEAVGLSGEPDVVLAMPGAWEFGAVRGPDGRVVEAQSAEMRELLVESLTRRARAAHEVGAAFGLVSWACPGGQTEAARRDRDYQIWINDLMVEAAETARERDGVDAFVVEVTDDVCIDADPIGTPTEARVRATDDEVHIRNPEGARWLWDSWLGPAIVDRAPVE